MLKKSLRGMNDSPACKNRKLEVQITVDKTLQFKFTHFCLINMRLPHHGWVCSLHAGNRELKFLIRYIDQTYPGL